MKKISILVPAGGAILSSVVGTFEVFNKVNQYCLMKKPEAGPAFEIDLVGLTKDVHKLYGGSFCLVPGKTIAELEKTDLIIVTTIDGDIAEELEKNAAFIPWIVKQRKIHKAEIASLCVGAFLLAETGLLDGKSASTHWSAADLFRQRYPNIRLTPEAIITEDNGIYTSGGAFSMLNLILYLIEKYCGSETAIWCSKMFEIEFDRMDQIQFVIFNGQKDHTDEPIKKAQLFIEDNYGDKISVDRLAKTFALSRRNFIRRFKKATMNTPIEYIQRVKIEAAKKSFESSTYNINEVMYDVGYSDSKAFRTLFRKHTGLSPIEYKRKYSRIAGLN